MAKPQIKKINAFDANYDTVIYFYWAGFQPYHNRIIIYNNSDMSIVYDDTKETMQLAHEIPAYTLENGNTYIIQCQVIDSYGNTSVLSDKYYFKTFTTPYFIFDNISDEDTISTTSCNLSVLYHQNEQEPLYYYKFYLYDNHKSLIQETDILYDVTNISYVFKGLDTETFYYVRCNGVTRNGINVDTGYVKINYSSANILDLHFDISTL